MNTNPTHLYTEAEIEASSSLARSLYEYYLTNKEDLIPFSVANEPDIDPETLGPSVWKNPRCRHRKP